MTEEQIKTFMDRWRTMRIETFKQKLDEEAWEVESALREAVGAEPPRPVYPPWYQGAVGYPAFSQKGEK